MKTRILVTGAGGGGTNNLIHSFRQSHLDQDAFTLVGSNLKPEVLAKSPLEENYLLPVATDAAYPHALLELVRDKGIDLIVPNNGREVARISELRDELPCTTFLPAHETIATCQDKYVFYEQLRHADIPMARTRDLGTLDDLGPAMQAIGGDRFWVRPKTGSGSRGATWVRTPEQARAWIDLWVELRDYRVDQFTVCEFLPGRDFAVQSVWKDGHLMVLTMCERLDYFFGDNKLSGMSSTPSVARTVRCEEAIDLVVRCVKALSDHPHGNFSFDLKGRADGTVCVTECNIGRFCMITPIFDLTGRYNTVEMHVRSALDRLNSVPEEPIDIDEGYLLLRELDTLPTIVHESTLYAYS